MLLDDQQAAGGSHVESCHSVIAAKISQLPSLLRYVHMTTARAVGADGMA